MTGFGVSIIIMLFSLVAAHLAVDRDFSPNVKAAAWAVLGVFALIYLIFGIF